MQYYIISKNTCQIKINGKVIGMADCNLNFFFANDGDLLELFPLDESLSPLHATLFCENSHSKNIAFYEYKDGFLITPFFNMKLINDYKVIFCEDFEKTSIRIFSDGQIKAFITNENASNLFYLPFLPTKFFAKKVNNLLFLIIKNKKKSNCLIFDIENTPSLKLETNAKEVFFNDLTFIIAKQVNFIRSDILNCEYDYSLALLNKKFKKSRAIASLSHSLLPFAFLEELSEGLPIDDFLLPALQQHKELIADFFGNFATFIPIIKDDSCSAILLYKNKAEEVSFNQTEGLISDFYFT